MSDIPEGVTVVVRYQSRDGAEFSSPELAEDRNQELAALERGNAILEAGGSAFDAIKAAYYWRFGGEPDDLLKKITKDTPLVIQHWQCSAKPGYKVCRLDLEGVLVYGDAGAWSGPFGGHVGVRDLPRYVLATAEAGKLL